MALLTKKQFADSVNMTTSQLAVYIGRRKVIVDNDLINPKSELNRAFLLKYGGTPDKAKKKKAAAEKDIPKSETIKHRKKRASHSEDPETEEDSDEDESEDGIMGLGAAEKQYQHWRALKNKTAVALAELEIAKKRGEYVATDLVKSLFQQHNQSVLMAMRNAFDKELRYVAKQLELPVDKVAEVKGRWIEALNEATDLARKATAKSISSIINDYIGAG